MEPPHPSLMERLRNRLNNGGSGAVLVLLASRKLNIVNAQTCELYFADVPKQVLLFFCPNEEINKYLRNRRGPSKCQELELPPNKCEAEGIRWVVNWMIKAAEFPYQVAELRVPYNLQLAISVSRFLRLFNLFKDATRVEDFISRTWFHRAPLPVDQVHLIWNHFPHDYKYNYHMIENVKRTLRNDNPWWQGARTALEEYMTRADPEFRKRVEIRSENNKYRPESKRHRERYLARAAERRQREEKGRQISPQVATPGYSSSSSVHGHSALDPGAETPHSEGETRQDSAHSPIGNSGDNSVPATQKYDSATIVAKLLAEAEEERKLEERGYNYGVLARSVVLTPLDGLSPEIDEDFVFVQMGRRGSF